jgi:predicted phage tail protein
MKAERWRFKAGAHRELCAFLLTISIFQRFYYNKRKIFYQCFVRAALMSRETWVTNGEETWVTVSGCDGQAVFSQ